jgi:hypothetical protein
MERMMATGPRLICLLAVAGLVALDTAAHAEPNTSVVNASGPQGAPMAMRLRRVLDDRGALARQPDDITGALDGSAAARPDLGDVRKAFSDFRYRDAEELLADLSEGLLASRGDIAAPLAEVLWWRGLIAAVDDSEAPTEQRRKAQRYFAAALALDPDVPIDRSVTSPRVRLQIDEAKRRRPGKSQLTVDVDAADAELSIDAGPLGELAGTHEVPAGLHLLRVAAPGRSPVLRLVDVAAGESTRLSIALPREDTADKVRRLVGETSSVPEGAPRLSVLTRLGGVLGVGQLLVIESTQASRAKIRLYDVAGKRMSLQFSFAASDPATAIATSIERAFALPEPSDPDRRWYQRWQVWTAVGGAVAAGVLLAVVVNNREPRIQGL